MLNIDCDVFNRPTITIEEIKVGNITAFLLFNEMRLDNLFRPWKILPITLFEVNITIKLFTPTWTEGVGLGVGGRIHCCCSVIVPERTPFMLTFYQIYF